MPLGGLVVGKDVYTKVYLARTPGGNPTPWNIIVKSLRVQERAVEAADGVCGEQRDRLMKIPNYFQVTADCFDDGQAAYLTTWIQVLQNDDAANPQLAMSAGLVFKYLNGTAGAFTFNSVCMGPLDYNVSGRTERATATVSFRAQYFKTTGIVTI